MWRAALFYSLSASLSPAALAHSTPTEFATNFEELRDRDRLLQTVGWRLLTGNAQFCDQTSMATGLLMQDAASYRDPSAVRSAIGIAGDIFIQSVVDGSPAAETGLREGEEVIAIGTVSVAALPLDQKQPWLRSDQIRELVALDQTGAGAVSLTLSDRSEPITISTAKICDSYLELISGGDNASTNGKRVAIGRDFVGFAYAQDELASALAHELAHNFLAHPQWLEANGRKRRDIRKTEREADRLMPWILANAGYEPEAARRFMRRWGPEHNGGLFRKRTHDGWDERVDLIETELPLIAASIAKHGHADWKADFIRQPQRD